MDRAREEARRLRHAAIDSAHILLALCREIDDEVKAFLQTNRLDTHGLVAKLEKKLKPGKKAPPDGPLPQTPEAKEALDAAVEAASTLGHVSLRPLHLWMGLVARPRGVVADLLGKRTSWEARLRKSLRSQVRAWPTTLEVIPSEIERTDDDRRALLSHLRMTRCAVPTSIGSGGCGRLR